MTAYWAFQDALIALEELDHADVAVTLRRRWFDVSAMTMQTTREASFASAPRHHGDDTHRRRSNELGPSKTQLSNMETTHDQQSSHQHPASPHDDLDVPRQSRRGSHHHETPGTSDDLGSVPRVDQAPMGPPAGEGSLGVTPLLGWRWWRDPPCPLAVHPQPRGSMERRRRSVLRWLADVVRVGRRSSSRPVESVGADGARGAAVPRVWLLDGMAARSVAEHVAAVSRLRVGGPTSSW